MVLVEICVDDLDGVLAAERAGADRVEICADLDVGGTTPEFALVAAALASTSRVGVHVMIRSRGGDFVFDADERRAMVADARTVAGLARAYGSRVGLVGGGLLRDGRVDESLLAELIAAADGLPLTFHKAFDATPDLLAAYDTLARHRVARVLTSGGAATAAEGAAVIASLVRRSARGGPEVLVGGAVRAENLTDLIARTEAREVHLRAQRRSPEGGLVTDEAVVAATVAAARSAAVDEVAVLALDVGGTSIKAAVVGADGGVRHARSVDTGGTGTAALDRVRDTLLDLEDVASNTGLRVVGAGVVCPGLVDAAAGTVRYASTLVWRDVPLRRLLGDAAGLPVAIGHDVRTAGEAELTLGPAAGSPDAVFVAIGTGVAAAIVTGGRVVDGAVSGAGELGHIPVVPGGEVCLCGQRGCLEAYFSGAGLARRYGEGSGVRRGVAELLARVDSDPVAARVWSEGLDALVTGLATVTLLVDPEVIVLGGGVARAGERLLAPVRERLTSALVWRTAPRLATAALGHEAGRVGAAMLGWRAAGRPELPPGWRVADVVAGPRPESSRS